MSSIKKVLVVHSFYILYMIFKANKNGACEQAVSGGGVVRGGCLMSGQERERKK